MAYFTAEDPKHRAPVTVDFSAASSLACVNNQSLTYTWNFGDGSTATGVNPSHLYNDGGVFKVTLTVKNASGFVATKERMISVEYPPAPGQILYMNLDGNIKDWSGQNSYKTEWLGYPTYVDVATGKAVQFSSLSNSYFLVNDNSALSGMSQFSLSMWVKKSTADASGVVMVKIGSYRLRVNANGFDAYLFNSNSPAIRKDLSVSTIANHDTNWHHYGLTYDGQYIRLYLDGILMNTPVSFSGNVGGYLGQPINFGKETVSSLPINASIDDIQVYNLALDIDKIIGLVKTTKPDVGAPQVKEVKVWGDLDGDNTVSLEDANLLVDYLVGMSLAKPIILTNADVSFDGQVNLYDAVLIARYTLGILLHFSSGDVNSTVRF